MRRYYKISPDYEKHMQLQSFLHSCQKAELRAEEYAKKFGAVAYHTHPVALAGGIAYLEFAEEPDPRIWRKVQVLDGQPCYEPNVMQLEGVMIAKDKFRPSDTSRKVFSKLPRTWNQVRPLKTLQQWAQMIHYKLTDDKEADAKHVHEQLKDCLFWHFIEYASLTPSPSPKGEGSKKPQTKKPRTPLYVKKAISAAVLAQQLPVVFAESLYKIIKAKVNDDVDADADDDKKPETSNQKPQTSGEASTPQYFYWENRGEWYVALDYEIESEDTTQILSNEFTYAMNTALREEELRREVRG